MKLCLDCGKPTQGTRCAAHTAQHNRPRDRARHNKQQAHGRDTAHYKRTRLAVLERDGYRCQVCGEWGNQAHLDPAMQGNHHTAGPEWYTTLCPTHHGQADGGRHE